MTPVSSKEKVRKLSERENNVTPPARAGQGSHASHHVVYTNVQWLTGKPWRTLSRVPRIEEKAIRWANFKQMCSVIVLNQYLLSGS